MSQRLLTKSRYNQALQCVKLLWLGAHKPELAAPADESRQHTFDIGHRVGELAQKRFPGGILVAEDHMHSQEAVATTLRLVTTAPPALFEAAAGTADLTCRADILVNVDGKGRLWDLHEVKSTAHVKDVHYPDVAFQKYCFEQAGFQIRDAYLMHIDRSYVRHGEVEPDRLLLAANITAEADQHMVGIQERLDSLLSVLRSDTQPEVAVGPQCMTPYECPFYAYCHADEKEEPYTIDELGGKDGVAAIAKLEAMGIKYLKDIPDDFPLSTRYRNAVLSNRTRQPVIDKGPIKAHLGKLFYPLYYFDFETIGAAIPPYDNSRPYTNLPFQYSLHIQKQENGPVEHREFLLKERTDPREQLVERMLADLGTKGTIVAYNMTFEKGVIAELATTFPLHSDALLALLPRFWDLIVPFRKAYAHYDFHCSASLKNVLPALVPSLSYEALAIQEGGDASLKYLAWQDGAMDEKEWAQVYEDLRKYCGLDTMAMVEIMKVLYGALD
jgi:hypothetical protein